MKYPVSDCLDDVHVFDDADFRVGKGSNNKLDCDGVVGTLMLLRVFALTLCDMSYRASFLGDAFDNA
ncbi:MAG: hypothetical protein BWY39_00276 [Spirochaetes bacterium ADurb.Bin269]|nr:MAG: hypothetical protein BWY39_00276 [Spirochaetes bacterium ADurb.Bin269]